MKLDYSEVRSIANDDLATGWDRALLMIYVLVHQGRGALPENPELALMMVLDLLRVFFLPIQHLCSLRLPRTESPLMLVIAATAMRAEDQTLLLRARRLSDGDLSLIKDERYSNTDKAREALLGEDPISYEAQYTIEGEAKRLSPSVLYPKRIDMSNFDTVEANQVQAFMSMVSTYGEISDSCASKVIGNELTKNSNDTPSLRRCLSILRRNKSIDEAYKDVAKRAAIRCAQAIDSIEGFYDKAHDLVGEPSNGTIKEVAAKVIKQFGLTKETTATRVLTILRTDFLINDTLAYFMQHYDEFDEDDARDAYMEVYYTVRDALEAEIVAQLGIEPGAEGYDEGDDYGHNDHMKGGREFASDMTEAIASGSRRFSGLTITDGSEEWDDDSEGEDDDE